MASSYGVEISMDNKVANDLKNKGFKLYAFRAVEGPKGGKPLVWMSTGNYFAKTNIGWEVGYGAFISAQGITSNQEATVHSGMNYDSRTDLPIELGQKMVVSEVGAVSVVGEGTKDTISIVDRQNQDYICGISEYKNGAFNPLCAFPLIAGATDLITPISKIVLMFATETVRTATVVEKALGPGITVDLTSTPNRAVYYDPDPAKGWSADTQGSAKPFASDADISPLLINPAR